MRVGWVGLGSPDSLFLSHAHAACRIKVDGFPCQIELQTASRTPKPPVVLLCLQCCTQDPAVALQVSDPTSTVAGMLGRLSGVPAAAET